MIWWAAAVHTLTALGAVCALGATLAIFNHSAEVMFGWLGAALFIDGIDGVFARAIKVSERLPRFSGERLDLVVDYLTYVFVPVLALLNWHYLDGTFGLVLGALILLSSLYHFADLDSKADDNSFVGFPAIWNIFAFYIFALDVTRPVTAVLVIAAIALTFLPMLWVHPWRVIGLRPYAIAASLLFAVAACWVIATGFPADREHSTILLSIAGLAIGLSVYRQWCVDNR